MIDLYYWTTANGHKITIFLEETGLPYVIKPINISNGDQFAPDFVAISPGSKIPAITDHEPSGGGPPYNVFESGAILHYLAEKTGQLLPVDFRDRHDALQWLIWQVASFGPMLGQTHHFTTYASETIPYAINRYIGQAVRLYTVLDRRLEGRKYIIRDYSIADIACYPWVVPHARQRLSLNCFPNVKRWFETVGERPAVRRAYAMGRKINDGPPITEKGQALLFGHGDKRDEGSAPMGVAPCRDD